jgi:hypothetical protein
VSIHVLQVTLVALKIGDGSAGPRRGVPAQALALLGWSIGRNVRIDTHWATANPVEDRRHAAELAAFATADEVIQ